MKKTLLLETKKEMKMLIRTILYIGLNAVHRVDALNRTDTLYEMLGLD